MSVPPGPWHLSGECVVALAGSGCRSQLPAGVHRLPGPAVVIAARYDDSPVGPYLEFAVAEPTSVGARPGMTVTCMVVTTPEARTGGRSNWGFPKELGELVWSSDGGQRVFEWRERGIVVRAKPKGPMLPALMPLRSLQRRSDGLVTVPGHLRGLARVARVEVEVPEGDLLAGLAGPHRGAVVSSAKLVMSEARPHREPIAAERSPRDAAEPALSWGRPGD